MRSTLSPPSLAPNNAPTATAAARRGVLFRARDLPRERAPVFVGVTARSGLGRRDLDDLAPMNPT
jgi:hypothetical protein